MTTKPNKSRELAPLFLYISDHCSQEQEYILTWIISEVLGLEYKILESAKHGYTVIKQKGSNRQINISNKFFQQAHKDWLKIESLSNISPREISISIEDATISTTSLFPVDKTIINLENENQNGKTVNIPFDLFGSIFFLITRYEEIIEKEVDLHERFHSKNSIASKAGLLNKAIGNEYIEILWKSISALWPSLKRKKRAFRILPSHDIDFPSFYLNKTELQVLKKCGGDIVKRKNLQQAIKRYVHWINFKMNKKFEDPFDTCDWLMTQSENNNVKSAFYYIPFKTHHNDPGIPIDHPVVEDQWSRIIARGHEIGCHPGYMTYNSQELLSKSVKIIAKQLDKMGSPSSTCGGRQHVLRWNTSYTPRFLDRAGLEYDSTLGYAESTGFRCGICYEYPMYDLVNRSTLNIRQRPLLIMDVSLFSNRYLGLNLKDAFDNMKSIKSECRKYNGDFTILWHNTELQTEDRKEVYQSILEY